MGIARALASNPQLLLLDEPTSALDASVQEVILKLPDDLRRQLGTSFLFVSHDLKVVRLMCERVYVMYLGRIIEAGAARQVFEHPRHPYTQALVSASPSLEAPGRRPRLRLDREPMSPVDPDPRRCRLYGRCGKGKERCYTEMPLLTADDMGHAAACHYPATLPVAGGIPASPHDLGCRKG